jgi:hypothetical protein
MTPLNGTKFLKFENEIARAWKPWELPVKFVNHFRCGYLVPIGESQVYINDKFFMLHNIGFALLGHTEEPVQNLASSPSTNTVLKQDQELINDDIGSHKFFNNQFRVEFTNMPLLRELGLKTMWYFDTVYYPQEKYDNGGIVESIMSYTRLSHGIGKCK